MKQTFPYIFFSIVVINCFVSCKKVQMFPNPSIQAITIAEVVEPQASQLSLHSNGGVYFACDFGPYNFTLDSLIQNFAFAGNLQDSALHLANGFEANYDYEFQSMSDANNITFSLERNINAFNEITLTNVDASFTVDTIEYIYNNDTISGYPFYHNYKIISPDFELELYVLNRFIGGCLHDEMVWFYYN